MKQFFLLTAFLFFTCLSFAQTRNLKLVPTENPVVNQTRKAVVIGMSAYGGANTLDNTLNDANDMAEVLRKLGFEVTLLENDDLQSLRINLNNWYNSIEGNDMAVFYYAGHGMSDSHGKNYLIPIGANLLSEADLETYTLSITNVLNNMDAKNVKMKLLILDACRSNEFSRSWNRGEGNKGLSAISAEGTYIAFATAPNSTALDGGNYGLHNGIFTYYLLQEIVKPGLTISKIFDDVAKNVNQRTDKKQSPFRTNGLSDDFYFIPGTPGDNPTPYNPSPAPTPNNLPAPVTDVAELIGQADAFYNNKQYDKAFPLYKQAADQGNDVGQSNLGFCYENGWGVTQDYNQAVYWYRKAADQGNAYAQNNLGDCYENGQGVTQDYNQAVNWYKKAADQGLAQAQNNLGDCYENGQGVTQDYNQAFAWYKKAADQGNDVGQSNLGWCYGKGRGVTQDYNQAVYWYRKAADQGLALAQNNLGACYENGWGVTQDYNQAVVWYKKAANQGNVDALNNLKRLGISYP